MSTTTTDTCWCGAEAVLFAVGGDQPPQQWCEEHQPDDPYEAEDFIPDLSDEPAAPAPAPAVAASRGLLWLAEVCRDLGVEVASIHWESFARPAHRVQVRDLAALGVLGDWIGLAPLEVNDQIAWRHGAWADLEVRVFCGVEA